MENLGFERTSGYSRISCQEPTQCFGELIRSFYSMSIWRSRRVVYIIADPHCRHAGFSINKTSHFSLQDSSQHSQQTHQSQSTKAKQTPANMSKSIVNTHAYPFQFEDPIPHVARSKKPGVARDVYVSLPNVRGVIPSIQASRLRTMMLEAHRDPSKILAHCCSMDGMSSRLVEEAGFPMVFLAGYPCASSYG